MFVSPCSLRSTQCAALIALATAAGIMRMDVAEARSTATRSSSLDQVGATETAHRVGENRTHFQFALDAVAPWVALFRVAAHLVAECPPRVVAPIPPAASPTSFPFPARLCCGPTARQHSYPFAVGPPAPTATSLPRADDAMASADSAARRTIVSRVAVVSFSSFSARQTRPGTPGPRLAGMYSSPSSALRGEPDAPRPPFVSAETLCLRSRIAAVAPASPFTDPT